ncbi:hypothetical protein LQW54_010391 [Pestalotiopsis sp. IQ-011]
MVLSIIVLALSAYAMSLLGDGYYYGGAPGYLIFLAIKSWIIYGATIFFVLKASRFFYRLVLLIAYLLSAIFWLVGWAWSASWAGAISSYHYRNSLANKFGGAMAGDVVVGAIIWILVLVNLVFFIMASVRDDPSAVDIELGRSPKHQPAPTAHPATITQSQASPQIPPQEPSQSGIQSEVQARPEAGTQAGVVAP